MSDDTVEILKAIVTALKADATLGTYISTRVYDRAPQDPTYPFVQVKGTFGEPYDGTGGFDAWECIVTIHTWARTYGTLQARNVMARIETLLHDQALSLDTANLVNGRLEQQRTLDDPDGVTTHGIQTFRFVTD